MKCARALLIVIGILAAASRAAEASVKAEVVRETAEYVLKKFGAEAGEETVETLSRKLTALAAAHGDEVLQAVRKAGPRAATVIAEAGSHAPEAARLISRYGADAVWLATRRRSLELAARHGDDAARAMMKHPEIAEPLIEQFGSAGAKAMAELSSQNGRRLAMLAEDGTLKAAGRAEELLNVVGRFGDRAADFIWRHKGALAVSAAAAAFVQNPEAFMSGAADLGQVIATPLAEAGKEMGRHVGQSANWTVVLVTLIAAGLVYAAWRTRRRSA